MKLVYCSNECDKIRYLNFCKSLYNDNSYFRNTIEYLINMIVFKNSKFFRSLNTMPVMVINNDKIVSVATYIVSNRLEGILQIVLFEALQNSFEAVDLIIAEAKSVCRIKNLSKISIGTMGHINYGLGMLADNFDESICFGSSYNPSYYIEYFEKYNPKEIKLVTFIFNTNYLWNRFRRGAESKILGRNKKYINIRNCNFTNFDDDVVIYNYLNNICFKDHPYYFHRSIDEDLELLNQYRDFIDENNFLIAEKDGKAIGYMLWFPDINTSSNKYKVSEIGVLPEYQGNGVILSLFDECINITSGKYEWSESGWILDTNIPSKGFGIRWGDREYKHYKVFEIYV